MKKRDEVVEVPVKESASLKIRVSKQFWNPIQAIVITVVLFLSSQFVASLFFILLSMILGWNDRQFNDWFNSSAFPQFVYVFIAYCIVVAGIYYLLKLKGKTFSYIGLAKPRLSDAGRALVAYGIYMMLFIAITAIAKQVAPSLNLEQEQQLGFEANKGIVSLVFAGISLVILPPIVEELLCRGFLYTGLRSKLTVWPAAVITSIVFATAHLQFGSGAPLLWVAAIDTFVLSLVLVYLRETTGRLTSSIFLHMIKNAVAFCILFIFVS